VTGDEDRIGYLAGEDGGPLDADEKADLDELRTLLENPAVWAEPDAELEERVVSMITAEPTRELSRPSESAPSGRRPLYRPIVASMIVAALIAVVAAITIGVTSTSRHPAEMTTALAATSLDPGATGSATMTQTSDGWRIQLHTTGLPRLDNGRYYEAWLKNPSGILVPVGTFNQGPNVTLWAGVSPQDFTTLTVTEQMANGNPASSGLLVLHGQTQVHH